MTSEKALEKDPSRNIEEIKEVINCDADAETKCKMISNILTAKPHYFEESPKSEVQECEVTKSQDVTISKQVTLNAIESEYKGKANEQLAHEIVNIMAIIDNIPPATPQPNTDMLEQIEAEIMEYIDDLDIANEIWGIFDKYIPESEK